MMKQSRLAFSSQAGSSTSHIGLADAIVIDHSDDDDAFATPPLTPPLPSPGPLQPAKQDNYISSGTHAVISSSNLGKRPIKRPRDEHSTLLAQGVASGVMGKRPLSAASEGRLPSDLVSGLPIDAASSESKMCHQHRHTCLPLLQCTRLKEEGKRCPMKYCYWTLQRMYKQDAEQIIRAGRNVLGVDVKEHVGPDEASYLWKCPKCRGKCQCSLCRKRAGLEPLGCVCFEMTGGSEIWAVS